MVDVIETWLRLAAARVHEQARALTELDQKIGDGDHGINMDRGFGAIVASLDAGQPDEPDELDERTVAAGLVRSAGRTLISTVGGAAGPLYGTAFMRAGGVIAASDPALDPAELLVAALEAGIGGIESLGKAIPGEKTMLDALVPAAAAGRAALSTAAGSAELAAAMAAAAEAGAAATIPMLATKGRASYLGERSIGHQDPGATSSALLLRALADAASA